MASVTDLTARLSRTKSVAALRIRERQEEAERKSLAAYATKSADAKRDHTQTGPPAQSPRSRKPMHHARRLHLLTVPTLGSSMVFTRVLQPT